MISNNLRILLLAITFVLESVCLAYSQTYTAGTAAIAEKTISYLESHPREKVYLQADRNLYVAGDTLYFRAYVTLGESNRLSVLSSVLHVQLLNSENQIERSLNLQLIDGMASSDFDLSKELGDGSYHLKAYTEWMKNDGSSNFFDQVVQVHALSKIQPNPLLSKHLNNDIDVQFLPEGGNLVNGIISKIAFKAIGSDGLGQEVSGIIVDNQENILCHFSSSHLGMGFFLLKPENGKSYKAILDLGDGAKKFFKLPIAADQGVTLSVNNDSLPKAIVKIRASQSFYNRNQSKDFSLLIQDHGKITTVSFKMDSPMICLDVLKRHLHSGVATVTLFSNQNQPICEREFFVQNYDALNISLSNEKTVYNYGEQLNLLMNVKNRADSAVAGYFSVSVVNENSIDNLEDAETISSYLLMSSDLKGYIEKPGYYFSNITDQKLKDLDLVMLTHGYSGFEWKNIAENKPNIITAEKGIEISGQLKNLHGKPVEKGTVTLISKDGGTVLKTSSDDKGRFSFKNLIFYDSTKFVLSAVDAKGNNNMNLYHYKADDGFGLLKRAIQSPSFSSIKTSLPEITKNDYMNEQIAYRLSKNTIRLKEVQVKGVKQDNHYVTQSLAGAGNADQVMHADEIEKIQGSLVTSLSGRLRGVIFSGGNRGIPFLTVNLNGLNGAHPMLVIIDGAEVPATSVDNLIASEVETVEVLKYASTAIYGMNGGNGVLLISTKQGGGLKLKDISATGILPITVEGFYVARKFYSPKYNSNQSDLVTNFRSTLYWNPDVQTDLKGNASFSCHNLGMKGSYRVTIEGIDKSGNVGTKVIYYKLN